MMFVLGSHDSFAVTLYWVSKLTTKSYVFRECKRTLFTDEKDKGFTYSSFVKHESVIFIGVPSSTGELIDTITH